MLENFVLSELLKTNHATGNKVDISYYRTTEGREVDFILEYKQKFVAIEVKYSENISAKDLTDIKEFKSLVGKDFCLGVILCNAPRVIAFDDDIYLVPFAALWQ